MKAHQAISFLVAEVLGRFPEALQPYMQIIVKSVPYQLPQHTMVSFTLPEMRIPITSGVSPHISALELKSFSPIQLQSVAMFSVSFLIFYGDDTITEKKLLREIDEVIVAYHKKLNQNERSTLDALWNEQYKKEQEDQCLQTHNSQNCKHSLKKPTQVKSLSFLKPLRIFSICCKTIGKFLGMPFGKQ